MEINYSNSRPGAGKTFTITKLMATRPAKWLYAVDRNEVFKDRKMLIQSFSGSGHLQIIEINCDTTSNVRQDVRDVPSLYADERHVVVIVTNEALMTSDLSHYSGWRLCIDEIPGAWMHREVETNVSKDMLKRFFSIRVSDGKTSNRLGVKEDMDIKSLSTDSFVSDEINALYKAAKNGRAYCKIKDFDEVEKWDWWTIWDANELHVFDAVSIVANAFEESLTFKLMLTQDIEMKQFRIPEFRPYKPRKLTIKYFDENNRATSYFFKSRIGLDALKAVGAYLQKSRIDIWSCNHKKRGMNYLKLIGINKGKLDPCVAGSNEYVDCTSAAFIFSAKPGKTEMARISEMGLNFEDVVRSREIEPMIQFVTRLSNRDPDDSRDNEFFVYDKTQAEAIMQFFDGLGIGITTELEFIDLGIPSLFKTNAEKKAAKSALNRAAYAMRKTAK